MRDSYALKLLSLINCSKCIQAEDVISLLCLLPWALQKEVIRRRTLSRQERLEKATLSFKLLVYYYYPSRFPAAEGVLQPFHALTTTAMTFAEDSDWTQILNSGIALKQFILDADEYWSFSRSGTHYLENFFGFVRRSSLGDDQLTQTVRIITKTRLVYAIMHELDLEIMHSGRDNINRTIINDNNIELTEGGTDVFFRSLIHLAHLEIDDPGEETMLLSLDGMKEVFVMWSTEDYHTYDPICNTDVSPVANCRITARNIGA
jgi:hypothetical protein